MGRLGENRALKFLKRRGFKILEQNYKAPCGEADIIAADGEVLVFVEVKTRTSEKFGAPSEAVNYQRQKRYIKIAEFYIHTFNMYEKEVRFDIIEIMGRQINHIRAAFFKQS